MRVTDPLTRTTGYRHIHGTDFPVVDETRRTGKRFRVVTAKICNSQATEFLMLQTALADFEEHRS